MNEGTKALDTLGMRLLMFRVSKKLTQAQMAKSVEASTIGYQRNESDLSMPNSKILLKLYSLGLNINWLLTGEGKMLLADLREGSDATPMLVHAERLGDAIEAIDQIARARGIQLSSAKRGKLAALVYQYYMLDKAENETSAYLTQLMELVSI